MRSLPICQRRHRFRSCKANGWRGTYPVAEKIVNPDIDKDAYAPLEEALEIVLSGEHGVEARVETGIELPVYASPVLRGGVGAEQSPRLRVIEVSLDLPIVLALSALTDSMRQIGSLSDGIAERIQEVPIA